MSKREAIKTSTEEIVDYWSRNQDECALSVDWAEAHERCCRCGCEKHLQRCHADGPNVEDPEIMWDWIRAYGVPLIVGRKEY